MMYHFILDIIRQIKNISVTDQKNALGYSRICSSIMWCALYTRTAKRTVVFCAYVTQTVCPSNKIPPTLRNQRKAIPNLYQNL